jgi:Leucine-rich repeat (LRR) protein
LFFAIIGLTTLLIKLKRNNTVWFLARYNIASLFVVLILSSAFDWDMLISKFNLHRASQMDEISSLDKNYLLDISEGNIKDLYAIKNVEGFEVDSVYSYNYRFQYSYDINNSYGVSNSNELDSKVFDFLEDDLEGDWRSYSKRRTQVRNDIQQLHADGILNSLELQGHYVKSLEPIFGLTKITEVNLNSSNFNTAEKMAGINELAQLERLYLNNNYLYNYALDTLKRNNNLTHLTLQQNELKNLKFLKNYPNLDSLDLRNNKLLTLSTLPKLNQLQSLYLNENPLTNISKLGTLPNLKELHLNNILGSIGKFPQLIKLENLYINSSSNILKYGINRVSSFPALKHLDVSHNNMYGLSTLVDKKNKSKAPELKSLNVSNNELSSLFSIEAFYLLEHLDVSNNKLYNVAGLEKLVKLQQLNLSNNNLDNLYFLKNMLLLKELNLSNNINIHDFNAISDLNKLTVLILSGTSIRSLETIKMIENLQLLNVTGCRISSWETLNSFTELENLSVSFLSKEDIEVFKTLSNLKLLRISNTEESVVGLFKEELKDVEVY